MSNETQPEVKAEKKLPWWIWIPLLPLLAVLTPLLIRLFMFLGKEVFALIF